MSIELLVGLNVTDEAVYRDYRKDMLPILESMGGSFTYDFIVSDVLITQIQHSINRVFTICFPGEDTMKKFMSAPEYLQVKGKYFDRSVSDMTIIAKYEK